ncbi:RND transporter [Hydrogenovibrio sp. SC-1]|uniref:efflux RND transporter permease subunit n=1 Tax=Hydrogenovibrio sp. SC-1 TaxID=2065820 RepID=UPI000C79FF49|nr:MMPL family transporter [Hydrogenovibrio sp. SC-1]PLA74523.1 RND transporter [Hydrogenovibrio sp. SC-1]
MIKRVNLYTEKQLGRFGVLLAKYPKLFVVLSLLMVAISASHLPQMKVDTSTEGFLHASDPARIAYDAFRNQFGRDEKIVVAIETDDIFQLDHLTQLRDLHHALETQVPHLFEITSLINARQTQGQGDRLVVDDLMAEWPQTQHEANVIKQQALANPLYQNLLVNPSGNFTVLVLESNTYTSKGDESNTQKVSDTEPMSTENLDLEDAFAGFDEAVPNVNGAPTSTQNKPDFISDKENSEMVLAVADIVKQYETDDFKIYVAGSPSVTAFLKSSIMGDMQKFIVMILSAIALILALLFRRVSGVVLPLFSVFLAVLGTLGLMAWSGTPIKVMTQVMPSFLLAVGIGAAIHILAIFYKHFDVYGNKKAAIVHTLEHSGLAVIMTSLTTAAGMASFAPSSVAPASDLGIFSALGVMIALVFTLVLLPALILALPIRRKVVAEHKEHHDRLDQFLKWVANFSQDHAKSIVVVSLLIMLTSIGLASKVSYSHNPLIWFPENHPTRVATETIDDRMQGSISLELLLDTHQQNGLYNLAVLKAIEASVNDLQTLQTDHASVGKALSLVDVLKEIHQALNENRPEYYRLAENEKLIPQEILLFENSGSDDLQDFVDSQFSLARITVKTPWVDAFAYDALLQQVSETLKQHLPADITVTATGMIPLLAKTSSAAVTSSGESYVIAFVVIAAMLMLLLSSVKLGLLAMIPNLLPVLFILAVMVVFGLPLDLFTMLIGAIVIGIAVDDIVHFMHNFRRYHLQGYSNRQSVEMTLTSSGRAMMITTLVLFIGFMLYLFASMSNLFLFGLLTAIAFAVALIAVFLLAPALMALTCPETPTSQTLESNGEKA